MIFERLKLRGPKKQGSDQPPLTYTEKENESRRRVLAFCREYFPWLEDKAKEEFAYNPAVADIVHAAVQVVNMPEYAFGPIDRSKFTDGKPALRIRSGNIPADPAHPIESIEIAWNADTDRAAQIDLTLPASGVNVIKKPGISILLLPALPDQPEDVLPSLAVTITPIVIITEKGKWINLQKKDQQGIVTYSLRYIGQGTFQNKPYCTWVTTNVNRFEDMFFDGWSNGGGGPPLQSEDDKPVYRRGLQPI